MHHSQFGGGNLIKGEPVSAIIVEDAQHPGKWAAQKLERGVLEEKGSRLQGATALAAHLWFPRPGAGVIPPVFEVYQSSKVPATSWDSW